MYNKELILNRDPLTLLALGFDNRIPRSAIGYVADLQSPSATERVRLDRIQQLQRYVEIN
jgi:hypothetical protein